MYAILLSTLYAMSLTPSQWRQGKEVDAALMATILPRRRQHRDPRRSFLVGIGAARHCLRCTFLGLGRTDHSDFPGIVEKKS